MIDGRQAFLLARTDIGEFIPFLVFVVVMIAKAVKAVSERGRGGNPGLPLDTPPHSVGDDSDPGAQIRRFLEDLRRQANGETPPSPSPPPVAPPRPIAPRPPVPKASETVARRATDVRPRPVAAPAGTPRAKPSPSPAPVAAPATLPAAALQRHLSAPPKVSCTRRDVSPLTAALRRGPKGLREAVVLREVLAPPKALRRSV